MLAVVALLGAAAGYYSLRAPQRVPAQAALRPSAEAPQGSAPATSSPATAAATGDPSGADAAPPAAPIPDEVPELTLPDMDGKPHRLRDAGGHERLFNFWATWCEPCRREIPLLNSLQQQYAPDGLQVVGVAVDERAAVRKFIKSTPMQYLLLVGEDGGFEAAQKFGMALALPFSVFADAQNRIIAVKLGELHGDEAAAILTQMRALHAGTTDLETARRGISEELKRLAVERSKQKPAK
jgi:thiol-disulfide isomerase/thioredoxin